MFDAIFFSESYVQQLYSQIKKLEYLEKDYKHSSHFIWLKITVLKKIRIMIMRLKGRYHEALSRLKQALWHNKQQKDHFDTLEKSWQQNEQKRQERAQSAKPVLSWAIPTLTPELYQIIAKSIELDFMGYYHNLQNVLMTRFFNQHMTLYENEDQLKKLTLKLTQAYQNGNQELIEDLEEQYRILKEQKELSSKEIREQVEHRARFINHSSIKNPAEQVSQALSRSAAVIAQIKLLGEIKNRTDNANELFVFSGLFFSKPKMATPVSLQPLVRKHRSSVSAVLEQSSNLSVKPAPILWSKPILKPKLNHPHAAYGA